MINTIHDFYNQKLNKQYKDFVSAGNKTSKVVSKYLHITPYDLGLMANLKPQRSDGISTVGNMDDSISYKQNILFCGLEMLDCIILLPGEKWAYNKTLFIYKSVYKEIGYFSNGLSEVLVFHTMLSEKIGFIDNSDGAITKASNRRMALLLLTEKKEHSVISGEFYNLVKSRIVYYQ